MKFIYVIYEWSIKLRFESVMDRAEIISCIHHNYEIVAVFLFANLVAGYFYLVLGYVSFHMLIGSGIWHILSLLIHSFPSAKIMCKDNVQGYNNSPPWQVAQQQ